MIMSAKEQIDKNRLPQHLAVIMDGNGRWAKKHGKSRVFGHKNGVKSVREVSEGCAELGIPYLTLYAFSTENWSRPPQEVNALMTLLVGTIKDETKTLNKNDIRLNAIGDLKSLPSKAYSQLMKAIEKTAGNKRMVLTLALSYSSKWEMLEAIKAIAGEVGRGNLQLDDIVDETVKKYLTTYNMPDPELLIRTSGEHRISNFLLWQIAYAELYFTDKLWPDFDKEELYKAILDYQHRERRFGKTSEQIQIK